MLLSNAEEDRWANPDGTYAILRAAAPVYALFGEAPKLPPELTSRYILRFTPFSVIVMLMRVPIAQRFTFVPTRSSTIHPFRSSLQTMSGHLLGGDFYYFELNP